ncbi:right-handed parallel beta-helix repeat-containing protein [Streptomyces morookaense]|uniref:right-handed parallel beta-helix repeat-containing protein n=1 Tax=Streptomyces morookaense TaxID=1970 RepID=UPI0033FF86DF
MRRGIVPGSVWAGLIAGAALFVPAPASAAGPAHGATAAPRHVIGHAVGTTYYVDCAAGDDSAAGTGPGTAWRTLAKAGSRVFAPGDTLRLRGGTTCTGTLAPRGSGSPGMPVTIESYGSDTARIDGGGASAAVLLHNVQYYELKNITVTNTGAAPAQRAGIRVLLEDYGTGHHYVLSHVTVRDVNGTDDRYPNPSGGILFEAGGASVPTGFSDVHVTGSQVSHVDRVGIGLTSDWQRRAEDPTGPGTVFVPADGVVIDHNTVTDTGGDGIVVFNGRQAKVEYNTVSRYNMRSKDYNIGAFAWNSDHTLFAHNTVTQGHYPGIAFAVEGGNTGTVYEYNYSRDNEGGFLYFCQADGQITKDGVVRYNISQNDAAGAKDFGLISSYCTGVANLHIDNNTFYAPDAPSMVKISQSNQVAMRNNIFVGRSQGSDFQDPYSCYQHNLFDHIPALPPHNGHSVTGDPLLVAPGTATWAGDANGYALKAGSPALYAGTPVANDGQDFFGNPVPGNPSIGAFQGRPQYRGPVR